MRKHLKRDRSEVHRLKKSRREDSMVPTGPGHRLRIARENCLLTRDEVAKQLRLRKQCIASLERDEYNIGAPFIFVRGYLRAYARLVSLPPDEIVSAFDGLALVDNRPQTHWLVPKSELVLNDRSSRWLTAGVLFGLLILLIIWWQSDIASIPDLSKSNVKPAENTLDSVAKASVSVDNEVPPEMPLPVAEMVLERLDLTFSETCWVEVYDADQAKIYVGLKDKGDSLNLTGKAPFKVLLGNPKAVQLSMNNDIVDLSRYKAKQTARITVG